MDSLNTVEINFKFACLLKMILARDETFKNSTFLNSRKKNNFFLKSFKNHLGFKIFVKFFQTKISCFETVPPLLQYFFIP